MAQVKICGLRRPEHIEAAADAGARYVGLVFFPKSPRAVSVDEAASLVPHVPVGMARVGLFVDPDDALLDAVEAHPVLINRPMVATPKGVRLCRPSEAVLDLLDSPLPADFTKEDGERVPARRA